MKQGKLARGFSLTELIVVMLVVGIVGIYISIAWSGGSMNLSSQATSLASDLRYAQNLAMTKSQRFSLIIIGNNTYQMRNAANVPINKPGTNGATVTLAAGVVFGTPTGITKQIIFDSDGIPHNDSVANPTITTQVKIPLVAGTQVLNVTVDPITGRITP